MRLQSIGSVSLSGLISFTYKQGLLQYKESVEYWKKAIAALPAENLTAPERRQKEQYTMEMKAALERAALMDKNFIVMGPEYTGRLPWDRVKAMEADMQADLPASARSSVRAVHNN